MGQARQWVRVALAGLAAASLSLAAPGPSRAVDVVDWRIRGSVEAGGMYSFGERSSSKFNDYRDMDNGFIGSLSLQGEATTNPYHFDLNVTNPAREDQKYDGDFGQYGLFQLDLGWDRVPHVLSNHAETIFQQSGLTFTLPSTSVPFTAANAQSRVDSLTRPVDLRFNTDTGQAGFNLTPTEEWTFEGGYENIRRQGIVRSGR